MSPKEQIHSASNGRANMYIYFAITYCKYLSKSNSLLAYYNFQIWKIFATTVKSGAAVPRDELARHANFLLYQTPISRAEPADVLRFLMCLHTYISYTLI
jgi:hypothetical protein